MLKLLPVMHVPLWLGIWIAVIAAIKAANLAAGYIRQKQFVSVHSGINKAAGGLLFVFPLTLGCLNFGYGAAAVCTVATIAAIQEAYLVKRTAMNGTNRA